jgi:hypothetical protein
MSEEKVNTCQNCEQSVETTAPTFLRCKVRQTYFYKLHCCGLWHPKEAAIVATKPENEP